MTGIKRILLGAGSQVGMAASVEGGHSTIQSAAMFEKHPHIGSTAFERVDGGFVYYASAWSKGIPVSAAARDAYIHGPRSAWFEAIIGQEATVPRRPYWATVRRILTASLFGHDPGEPNT